MPEFTLSAPVTPSKPGNPSSPSITSKTISGMRPDGRQPRFDLHGLPEFGHVLGQLPQSAVQFYVLIKAFNAASAYATTGEHKRPRLSYRGRVLRARRL
jgi:hypothetical protein